MLSLQPMRSRCGQSHLSLEEQDVGAHRSRATQTKAAMPQSQQKLTYRKHTTKLSNIFSDTWKAEALTQGPDRNWCQSNKWHFIINSVNLKTNRNDKQDSNYVKNNYINPYSLQDAGTGIIYHALSFRARHGSSRDLQFHISRAEAGGFHIWGQPGQVVAFVLFLLCHQNLK